MIKTYEGLGGWTIEVVNGKKKKRFECIQYIINRGGINRFDWDAAMRDAMKLDTAQQRMLLKSSLKRRLTRGGPASTPKAKLAQAKGK